MEEFRQGHASYRGNSFGTISGWASNGAIIHYHATPESNQRITGDNLYLVDSGGQYEYGTTDITHYCDWKNRSETKNCFTRVLKGHIAVASAVMDDTLDGASLDKLARASLQEDGKIMHMARVMESDASWRFMKRPPILPRAVRGF